MSNKKYRPRKHNGDYFTKSTENFIPTPGKGPKTKEAIKETKSLLAHIKRIAFRFKLIYEENKDNRINTHYYTMKKRLDNRIKIKGVYKP